MRVKVSWVRERERDFSKPKTAGFQAFTRPRGKKKKKKRKADSEKEGLYLNTTTYAPFPHLSALFASLSRSFSFSPLFDD